MTELKFYKLNAVPTVWEANAFYLIKSNYVDGTGNVEYAENYITNALAVPKAVGNATMIGGIVDKKIADAVSPSSFKIVADIAARNLLPVTASFLVLVLDATADTSVASGAALYAYNLSTTSFSKVV